MKKWRKQTFCVKSCSISILDKYMVRYYLYIFWLLWYRVYVSRGYSYILPFSYPVVNLCPVLGTVKCHVSSSTVEGFHLHHGSGISIHCLYRSDLLVSLPTGGKCCERYPPGEPYCHLKRWIKVKVCLKTSWIQWAVSDSIVQCNPFLFSSSTTKGSISAIRNFIKNTTAV